MKKAVSLILSIVLLASAHIPMLAQKRGVGGSKTAPILVESTRFATAAAYSEGDGVWISWDMEVEVANIGFYVYRLGGTGTVLLSPEKMVQGAAQRGRELTAYGQSYSFFDASGDAGNAYYIEALGLDGSRVQTPLLNIQPVGNLKAFSGFSSAELAERSETKPQPLESSVPTLTKEIQREIAESQLIPDPVTHRSVISQPGVVRIGVKTAGIYRVSRLQLEAAGFNVESDSNLWQLYVEGVEQAIAVGANGSYIEFYGRGADTPETDIRKYFLRQGSTAGLRMETRVATRNTSTVLSPSYQQTFVKKERNNYVDDITNGDLENYFGRGIGALFQSLPFALSGIDLTQPTATLGLRFQGYSNGDHVPEVTLNNQLIGTIPGSANEEPIVGSFTIPTSLLIEGVNTLKVRSVGPAGDFVYFDTVSVDFARRFLADQNKLAFYTQNYRAARLEGFTSANVRLFDVTREGFPSLITNLTVQPTGPTFGITIPAGRGRSYFAVEDSAILAPESVTPNNSELVGVPTNAASLVIISYKDFMTEAEAWATYRRSQGFIVKVIEVTELFDEFSYGQFSSDAIKSFLQYAHGNWATAPQYVLLIGDGSYDSRNYESLGYFNYVPPKRVTTQFTDTVSDEGLVDFDNDGLAEMAIGRIASRTPAGITTLFNKTVSWETNLGADPLSRGALFAHDYNNGYNFQLLSAALANQLPPGTPTTMVFRGEPNANANLLAAMDARKFVINYAGHGTSGSWGGSPLFFNVFSVPLLADNPNNPAIFTMLTCLNGSFHNLYNDSFAEVLTKANNRGAVAAWASTGMTTADVQAVMALRFYDKIGDGDIPRIGDLIKDAKASIVYGPDVRLSWALIGDPMLKVR